MSFPRMLLCLSCLGMFTLAANADDWPQWRGPKRNGISAETGLLQEWPKEGPKQLWHADMIGNGYSTPSIIGDRIYLISNEGTDNEFVQALDAGDGHQVWSTKLGNVGPNQGPQYPGSRSTPTVDGELLYALGSNGDLVCLERAGGKERWRKNLRTDFGGQPGKWAYSESPLIDGDVLVCSPGGKTATLVTLKKATGEVLWKSPLPEADEAAYASAIVDEVGGIKQYVQFLQKGLVGVEAATGKLLWRYGKTAEGSPANIPTPIAEANFVYSAGGRSGGGLVKLTAAKGKVSAEQVYFTAKLPTSIGGTVLVDGYLYGTNRQGMMCAEFSSGDIKWQERGIGASSICFADGRLYLHGEEGDVALLVPSAESYKEVGRFTPANSPDRGKAKAWTYPVVANGRLYIRDLTSLWCYDIKQ